MMPPLAIAGVACWLAAFVAVVVTVRSHGARANRSIDLAMLLFFAGVALVLLSAFL